MPWPVLAAIGSIETDHGRSRAPGVHSGVNSYGCCAGPMQFNLRDGPPSTWDRYGVDGNRDGKRDVYDPADAIASAANYLRALLRQADGDLGRAVFGYNHSQAYVDDVLARARAYAGLTASDLAGDLDLVAICADIDLPVGPANLRAAERVSSPRAFRVLPAWAMAPGRAPQAVDARIHDDVMWILRRYRLRVTAAREAGHRTHGDGTALDLVPANGTAQAVWDALGGPARPRPRMVARRARGPARARSASSHRRSSSSATTATPATAPLVRVRAAARRTCTSPGPRPATEPAPYQRPARGSCRSPSRQRRRTTEADARPESDFDGR